MVRAEYSKAPWFIAPERTDGPGERTLCVDPDRHLVLRDVVDATITRTDGSTLRRITTVTLEKVEINPEFDASIFVFSPPPDASSQPVSIYRSDPAYDENARKKHIEGTVVLSLLVGADGIPHDVQIIKSLYSGLDKKAVECVKTWRFKPGMKDGQPVKVRAQVEVNFKLLDKR